MKKAKLFSLGIVAVAGLTLLGACGNGGKSGSTDSTGGGSADGKTDAAHSVAIVTDIGGVDDRSFNQSAWEGLEAWGKEHNIARGVGGYDYVQSIEAAAAQNPDTQFGIIDDVIEGKDNVVSATFKDNEAAYLAGFAAAYTTKTNKVGFIGGEEGVVIDRFEAGFIKGVEDASKALGKEIKIDSQYAASFGDPAKGKALAASMYQGGVDVIFHASGGTGAGVFQEAKAINEQLNEADLADKKVWVIGVDSDQQDEGAYKTKDGKEDNFTLASTLKGVGAAVQDISTRAL